MSAPPPSSTPEAPARVSRRGFLAVAGAGAAGALVLGVYVTRSQSAVPGGGAADAAAGGAATPAAPAFAPNLWLSIAADGATTILLTKAEMGQGVYTALPMLVAEELDADWSSIRVEQAIVEPRVAAFIGTGGSSSVSSSWEPLRRAGAAAREMLVTAAASRWNVPAAECRTESGIVIHTPSGRRAPYGSLVDAARQLAVPAEPRLKARSQFRLIGTRTARLDLGMKVDGSAIFGGDIRLPGLLFAVVARCPVYGGTVASFDATRTKALAGVRHVIPLTYTTASAVAPAPASSSPAASAAKTTAAAAGIAVVATSTWAALEGRRLLEIQWDEGAHREMDSAWIARHLDERAKQPGVADRNDGDVSTALAAAHRTIDATYAAPFLPHLALEPLVSTAIVQRDRCEMWGPFQYPDGLQGEAVVITGLPAAAITIHTTMVGGGFGRKAYEDFGSEALHVAKAIPGTPVQLLWSREDDVRFDKFRPPSRHMMSAGFDARGRLTAWRHKITTPSLRAQWEWGKNNEDILRGLDTWATATPGQVPYRAPNFRVEFVMAPTPVPVGAWRGVYCAQTAFADECFVDELAVAVRRDPCEFRLSLLGDDAHGARMRAVLEQAARAARWGQPLAAGRFQGIAAYFANDSYVAQVAEVSVTEDGQVRVHRVTCAADCGIVVNPDIVETQMEGSVLFGLSAALSGEITFAQGRCEQSNFHDAPLLRLRDAPAIEVHLLPSDRNPTGVGEPAVPPIGAATANAVSAAIGRRIRELPLTPARIAARRAAPA